MSCSLRLPLRQPRPRHVTTPLTCLLSAEAARVVVCLSPSLSPSLPCAVFCFFSHKSRVFCVHFGGKLQVVVRRFVALFNLDKLKTMPHLPHATHTLATWGTERGREGGGAANTLLKLQASRESPPPAPRSCLLQPSATSCVCGECPHLPSPPCGTCNMPAVQHTCNRCGSN